MVLVCSILCPALCSVASASELSAVSSSDSSIDFAGDSFSVEMVEDPASVMTISLADTSSVGNPTITFSKPVYFGVSGAQSTYLQSTEVTDPNKVYHNAGIYSLPEATSGTYLKFDAMTEDLVYPVSLSYPDIESIDFYGTAYTRISCTLNNTSEGELKAFPTSMDILINGRVVTSYARGDSVDYTYTLAKGQNVSSVGFRFHYDEYFNLGATQATAKYRILQVSLGSVSTHDNNSTSGWFNMLFSWLANIRDRISNVLSAISSGFSNVVNSIAALPSKIADAVKGLFVPSDSQMDDLKASFNTLLSEKLGFVYQAGSLVTGVFDAIFDAVDNPDSDVTFIVPAFPAFNVDGTDVSLWEDSIVVDIADNQVVQIVQQVASPFVIAVMVWGFVHSMEDAFLAFVGGKSLSDWVRDRKGAKE